MKYKDYLIVPIIAMYLIFTSFAYVQENSDIVSADINDCDNANLSPESINLGDDTWYADGCRASDSFVSHEVKSISIDDMHMICATNEGKKYDFVFVDEMTAYDCYSDTYYERADYATLVSELMSGKFINESNYNDYYVFGENSKSTEYYGEKIFRGEWSFDTSNTLLVYDNVCNGYISFEILFDSYGNICGISNSDYVYNLVV